MATFLKGDIHGNLFEVIDFINRFNLGKNDNIIILGDFYESCNWYEWWG